MEVALKEAHPFSVWYRWASFNPYSNGSRSKSVGTTIGGNYTSTVSILILMEVALKELGCWYGTEDEASFNPYSNGSRSKSQDSSNRHQREYEFQSLF